MGRKHSPGLIRIGNIWHIDKRIRGFGRLCRSTGTDSLEEAEDNLAESIRQIKEGLRRGRPLITWRQAATKYLQDFADKSNIETEAGYLEDLDTFIGSSFLEQVHDEALRPYVQHRRRQGRKTKTINNALALVRHILNLCASSWRHPNGKTWLETAPKIAMQDPPRGLDDSAKPYPLDWKEQEQLFKRLPLHLARMALFDVNTGCRESEVCGFRWAWEWHTDIEDFRGRVFIVPGNVELVHGAGKAVKNREDKLVVLNDIAKSVVDACRGDHPEFVFTRFGKSRKNGKPGTPARPVRRMHNTAWKRAWRDAGLPVNAAYKRGVHNLRHTFGRRLRAAGVPKETRQVLLGHKNKDITTHYSAVELRELLDAVQRIAATESRKTPELTLLKMKASASS
jgi:integrase